MKKSILVFILILMFYPQLNAQIFYNIEMPPSYQKSEITNINNLHSINYDVDYQGNLSKNNLSINVRDYLIIEKIGEKNIGRVKFNVTVKSLGELTLRFSNVKLNKGAHCYVYTSDYDIVAGPVYENSISNTLNIVKIPTNELILEIVFENINDFDLILNSISYQSIIDVSKKNNNSLQGAISPSDWNCDSCKYGEIKFVDNFDNFTNNDTNYTSYGASLLGMSGDSFELFFHPTLYCVNDLKLDAARAACVIMPPTTDGPYTQSVPGTLINFPGMDCKGIVISAYHVWQARTICDYQKELNEEWLNNKLLEDEDSLEHIDYLANTIIRFNWHHKYGKPMHLKYKFAPTNANFKLWRKTIDFDEVIDYCGATGFAYSNGEAGEYTIIKMKQMPYYKELHLGWTTEAYCDSQPTGPLRYPERFMVLGRHAASPTYVFKNNGAAHYYNGESNKTMGIDLTLMYASEKPIDFVGYSGSQLIYQPDYPNSIRNLNPWIGIGIIKNDPPGNYHTRGIIYGYSFNNAYTNLFDPDLTVQQRSCTTNLFDCYFNLSQYRNELTFIPDYNGFYWMPSKENREKCPSTLGGGTDPCIFDLTTKIDVFYPKVGTMLITIKFGEINSGDFQGNQIPKGIRIYNNMGDQQTFYFDSFADGNNIDSVIRFTISQCDLFYYQMMGLTQLTFGIDYYDWQGRILNANGCHKTYSFNFPNSLCEAFTVTKDRISGPPLDSCCSYRIMINFKGCDDYSNIKRRMLDVLSIKNLNTQLETLITNQTDLNINYNDSTISFVINNICSPTSYKLLAPFGGSKNCESFEFALDCVVPEAPKDCCKLFNLALGEMWYLYTSNGDQVYRIRPYVFVLYFTGTLNDTYPPYCPDYQFISAHVYCPNSPGLPPIYDEIITLNEQGLAVNSYGTFEGLAPGTYCFYTEIITTLGICRDTMCVDYDGTFCTVNPSTPGPIIYIDESNNNNNFLPLLTKMDYEKVTIVDMNGKVLIESEPIDKIDVSKFPKGTYNVLYRNKDKIIQSQKLIIK